MPIDVTGLYDRRADNRWDRVCVGDILEPRAAGRGERRPEARLARPFASVSQEARWTPGRAAIPDG